MQTKPPLTKEQIRIMKQAFELFKTGIKNGSSIRPKEWLAQHRLSEVITHAGYISVRFLDKKKRQFKEELESIGLLKKNKNKNEYKLFGKNSIVFPLVDKENNPVNFYSINLTTEKKDFLNEHGLYPHYPDKETSVLFLTKTILDAATLMEFNQVEKKEAVIALFDGELKAQHIEAIQSLPKLKKIYVIG